MPEVKEIENSQTVVVETASEETNKAVVESAKDDNTLFLVGIATRFLKKKTD